ncbi:MAG TPA: replicative DNA helicase [Anaerolineaceae bacterium]|nr:replicative DNA helicase [Anaerolineaceae bacterium]
MGNFPPYDEDATTTIQSQPNSREAEEAVLGSVLINPDSYFEISQIIKADDFYIIRNQWIWDSYVRLHEKRIPIDILTVSEDLEEHAQLSEIGGQAYLVALVNQTPTSLHAEAYAQIVEQTSIRRKMLAAANEMARLAYDEGKEVRTILDEAEKSVFGLSSRRVRHDLEPIHDVVGEYYDHLDELSKRDDEIVGVPTGLADLDHLLGGLQKSDLIIVAGRPGSGKTGFLLSVAKNAAQKEHKNVAMFSMEMSNQQLVQRLIAQETNIDSHRLRMGKLRDDEWNVFVQAMGVLGDTKIWLDDTPAITPLALRTKCRRLHMEYNLDLILVDYLQLMGSDSRNENRVQEVSYISRSLKVLARELDVPVLAAAQLSRAVEHREDKRPMLSDLRESGSLEQDADIVMFIHRPDKDNKESPRHNVAELIVSKHRNGPTGSIETIFLENLAKFENAAPMVDLTKTKKR